MKLQNYEQNQNSQNLKGKFNLQKVISIIFVLSLIISLIIMLSFLIKSNNSLENKIPQPSPSFESTSYESPSSSSKKSQHLED